MPVSSAHWVSQSVLQRTGSDLATALVSIRDPDGMHVGGHWADRLNVEFFDVDDESMSRAERWLATALGNRPELCETLGRRIFARNGWPWRPFLQADAQEISSFVRSLPAQVTTLLIACDYGRSRSRAVAEWAAGVLGHAKATAEEVLMPESPGFWPPPKPGEVQRPRVLLKRSQIGPGLKNRLREF